MAKSKMLKIEKSVQSKVVIGKYIRVSTDKQREEGYSIDVQRERLTNYTLSMFPQDQYRAEFHQSW